MKILAMLCAFTMFAGLTACATTQSASVAIAPAAPDAEPADPTEQDELTASAVKRVGSADEVAEKPMPQSLARTYSVAGGCEQGPGGLALVNTTEFHLALRVNGEDVVIFGTNGAATAVAPKAKVFLCLDSTKDHEIKGTALAAKGDALFQVRTFAVKQKVDAKGPVTLDVTYTLISGKK